MSKTTHDQFEWDEEKRSSTLVKHGIDFDDAIRIFDGRPAVHAPSDHPDEERWVVTASLNERIVTVVYTFRGDTIRIITARRARKDEERKYHESHPGGRDPPEG